MPDDIIPLDPHLIHTTQPISKVSLTIHQQDVFFIVVVNLAVQDSSIGDLFTHSVSE